MFRDTTYLSRSIIFGDVLLGLVGGDVTGGREGMLMVAWFRCIVGLETRGVCGWINIIPLLIVNISLLSTSSPA